MIKQYTYLHESNMYNDLIIKNINYEFVRLLK